MKYLEMILNSRLFEYVDKKDYMLAYESLDIRSRKYRKDELIFCENETIDSVCFVKSGRVKSEKLHPSGNIHIIDLIKEGEPFGYEIANSRLKSSFCDYVAERECEIVFISMDSIHASEYERSFGRALCSMISDESIKKINKSFILSENRLRERLMAYFAILQRKSGTNKIIVDMNREQLSDYLCINRSALSNELSKMRREGLIEINKNEYTLKYIK